MKNKKKLAFFIGDYTRSGGTERVCTGVVNGLARKDVYTIYLITTSNQSDVPFFTIEQNVKILYLNMSSYKKQYLMFFIRLMKVLKRKKIDALVAVEVTSLIFILPVFLIGKLISLKTKLIVWEHFNFSVNLGLKLRDRCRKWSAKFADYIVVLTERDVSLWKNNLKIRGKITSINNLSPFTLTKNRYNDISTNIIAIGRLTYQKGFDRLIDIWEEYIKTYPEHNNWKLQIIGSGVDHEMLKDKIKNSKMDNCIELISNTSNIVKYYENASFLAMTSRFEGLPMTLIEAQSFGLPLIAYNCLTGPAEVITEDSGFLIKETNQSEFVLKLNRLITNKELRIKMSKSAKNEYNRFSEDNILKRWNTIFKEVCD